MLKWMMCVCVCFVTMQDRIRNEYTYKKFRNNGNSQVNESGWIEMVCGRARRKRITMRQSRKWVK